MTQRSLFNDKLTDIVVLTGVKLQQDSRDTPDIIFPYLEFPLSTLAGLGNIAYVRFNPNSWQRRRNPATNETLYNIDLPDYGTSPDLEHALIGSRSHMDTSLKMILPLYSSAGVTKTVWSGMVWANTELMYEPDGKQIQFILYVDDPSRVIDLRYNTELFY